MSSSSTSSTPVVVYQDKATFSCSNCSTVVALQDELISKAFSGRDGRGYLMHSATNVKHEKKEDRALLTGVHTVADVSCIGCNARLGWYYYKASDQSQKYKEGKYLLERERLIKENKWRLDE
ncbi:yippee-domain-containing protein [Wolfiporia cocos MD-104 SS10]|uniref:Protein yippee-like n=1 Tax=Wolfiporia cocos (strain MD-104) TaxID=742152 RepID=A0A2H3J2X1_WOLCO|nr:yippee-domain-containing protein [Wolfiporia cocos MD-104 SS10]